MVYCSMQIHRSAHYENINIITIPHTLQVLVLPPSFLHSFLPCLSSPFLSPSTLSPLLSYCREIKAAHLKYRDLFLSLKNNNNHFFLHGSTSNSSELLNVIKDHCFKVGRSVFHWWLKQLEINESQ